VLATEIDEIMKRCFRSDCAMALTLALIARPIAALAYRLRFPDLSALAIPTTLWGSYQEAEQRLAQRGNRTLPPGYASALDQSRQASRASGKYVNFGKTGPSA